LDREDRWNLYFREHLKNEKEKMLRIEPVVEVFADMVEKEGFNRVADIGCGLGRHSLYLARRNFRVYGCDISEAILLHAEKNALINELDIQFVQADYQDLPFYHEIFGGALVVDTIHHDPLENIVKALKEIHRVLEPGGLICLNPPSVRDELFGGERRLGDKLFVLHRVPHYFFESEEIVMLLSKLNFVIEFFKTESYIQNREGQKVFREKFNIIARKITGKRTYYNPL
jgi:ubiquinone/menaquinone biosynthesis C-methylase UbiE